MASPLWRRLLEEIGDVSWDKKIRRIALIRRIDKKT